MALKQDCSCLVRNRAMVELGRKMKRPSWESIWNALGGVQGILALFADFSAYEIKQACSVLGRRNRGRAFPAHECCVEQILRALVPFYQHASGPKTLDERPLLHVYARLVPGCSTNFVAELLDQPDNPLVAHLDSAHIARYHPALLQRIIHQFGFVHSSAGNNDRRCWSSYPRLTHDLPSNKRDVTGFSPTMHFLSNLLDDNTISSTAGLPAGEIVGLVSAPLLRLAIKNKVSEDKVMHIINATLKYMEREIIAMGWSRSHIGSFSYNLALYWSRRGATMHLAIDHAFSHFLRLYGATQRHGAYDNTVEVISDLFPAVSRGHRYALLRHVTEFFTKPGINLNNLGPDKPLAFDRWSCRWFIDMNPSEALDLLKRLIRARTDHIFLSLERKDSIFSHSSMPGGRYSDPGILLTYLNKGHEGAMTQAENITHQMQKRSATSREQADRGFFAKSAMFYAIASGSMALYHEVVTWSRRYIKYPMTVRVVFGSESILTTEGIELLSGMYNGELHVLATVTDHLQVAKGNRILLDLFNLACSSLKEPSFNVNDWDAVRRIYRMVIERRIRTATFLQHRDHVSGETIYDQVWRDTLKVLIELERTACKPEHGRLRFNSAAGPLSQCTPYSIGIESIRFSSASYLFLDTLAEARDELWKDVRSSYSPAATSLGQPWPRGLPVQCLVPFDLGNSEAKGFTPFLSSRVAEVVFISELDSEAGIPPDEETRSAIGAFVHCYQTSLRIYILQFPEGRLRYEEVARAWQHAMKITRRRMEEREAIRFWRSRFEGALPFMKLDLPMTEMECREYPILPPMDGENETQEWDPASNQPAAIKHRQLPARAIDCFLCQSSSIINVFASFNEPRMVTLPFEPSPVWDIRDCKRKSAAVEEGLIASALLYIDSTDNIGSRTLAKPFPSSHTVRYPSLILDSDFLLSRDRSSTEAIEVLRAMISRIPSSLLLSLATGILSTSNEPGHSDDNTTTSTIACSLLALSTKSDQPQLACNLIVRTIVERPDTSAWHRQFLTRNLLCRLSATNSAQMLMNFAKAIEAKLDEQSGGGDTKDGKAQQPAVKATTVKYLAQLLNEPLFVSPRESLSILSSLFRKSTHRDIHYAIAESMLAMLAGTAIPGTSALADLTLQALQALIPVAGRLNERTGIQEKDWMAFGRGGKIPPIEDKDSTPPLLSLLLEYASKSTLSETVRRPLVEDIILPAYETCRIAYNRWVAVLLSRFNALEDLEILSSIPSRPVALAAMLRRIPELLPEEYFMEWHNYVKTYLAPSTDLPAAIYRLADNLRSESTSDPTLTQDTNASSHWMRFLDQRTNIFGAFSLANLLQRPQARSSLCLSDRLISLLQKLALEQADILIKEFDTLNRSWRDFLAPLRGCGRTWKKNCAPILDTIILRVESYRNDPRWRDDPDRKPQFLPPSFDLRLALIAAIGEDEHVKIAEEVLSLVRNIIASGRPYHHELDQIKRRILNSLGTAAQVQVACCLGKVEDNNDAEPLVIDFLRVDLAHWLLRKADQRRDGSEAVREAFEKSELILLDWSRSKIEEFRMRGAVRFDRVAWSELD
ncbi:MAG: hypothetical protein L6R42_005992 [Xanthoria sp. 1 TBL-2021]|nr:MAG: hypothetical protein L6R42_005992 [Xanthoria sp. 1 TBL-2021]